MREIKFRAWGVDGGVGPKMWPWESIRGCLDMWLPEGDPNAILMQFTGLKDRNGKEIYEGDVVEDAAHNRRIAIWGYECWNGEAQDACIGYEMALRDGRIIGNIYENPELKEGI